MEDDGFLVLEELALAFLLEASTACYNWISKYINKHDSKFICEAIKKQRIRQKRELNKKLKYTNTNAYIILIKSNIKRNQLAKYLYVNGAEKRTGDFGSIVAYIKGLKEIPKK